MTDPSQYEWDQTPDGQQIDLRFTCQSNGKITVHPLKGGEDQHFDSYQEAADWMSKVFEQGTQQ